MRQKVFRSGHSLAVVVPADFARDYPVKPGDSVLVQTDKQKGKIIYQFSGTTQLSLEFKKK